MGSSMKPTIFNDRVANALRTWHQTAKKNVKQNRQSNSTPTTPLHSMSPVHLLRHYQTDPDSIHTSPRMSNFNNGDCEMGARQSPAQVLHDDLKWSKNHTNHAHDHIEIEIPSKDFSFSKDGVN